MSKHFASLLLMLLIFTAPAAAQYTFSPEDLYAGQAVTVTLPAPADTLTVTYRPNSSIPMVEHIPTAGRQTVSWTPSSAGVIALSTPTAGSQNVSVRFRTVPGSGIFVLALAGFILFGGIVFSFRKLFEGD